MSVVPKLPQLGFPQARRASALAVLAIFGTI
jgi:hypothetical protein